MAHLGHTRLAGGCLLVPVAVVGRMVVVAVIPAAVAVEHARKPSNHV